jgi:hypothetical protein
MSLIVRCPDCRSHDLEIRPAAVDRLASLHCPTCDRFLRWLKPHQAKAFARHLPKPKQIELPGLEVQS